MFLTGSMIVLDHLLRPFLNLLTSWKRSDTIFETQQGGNEGNFQAIVQVKGMAKTQGYSELKS